MGISPVCILGVNINRGQEISLRLRTDDLKGELLGGRREGTAAGAGGEGGGGRLGAARCQAAAAASAAAAAPCVRPDVLRKRAAFCC